jgi:hypothetical protein
LITGYLAALSADLPAGIVDELADGLDQTRRQYLELGQDPDAAAQSAIADFGEPQVIVDAFTRASPARRTARKLLASGPVAGACWGTALITGRAWRWPVPVEARVVLGLALMTVIALLAAAAFGRRYRSVSRSGAAACLAIVALDSAMVVAAVLVVPALIWPLIAAIFVSAIRATFAARTLRLLLAACAHSAL